MDVISQKDTASPNPIPEGYDWRKEPWVKDVSDIACYIGMHLEMALRADGGDGDEDDDEYTQADEDAQVFALLNPAVTEMAIKSPAADEIMRYRRAQAISQAIEMITRAWEATPLEMRPGFRMTQVEPTLQDLPNYGENIPIARFDEAVKTHAFIDYDGHGYFATATQMSDILVKPSEWGGLKIPSWATHVMWFNR